jgi:hypothetical protein
MGECATLQASPSPELDMLNQTKRQRQAYALRRYEAAVNRLVRARTPSEKLKAGEWARRWSKAAGQPYLDAAQKSRACR